MYLRCAEIPALQTHCSDTLHLSPTPRSELSPEAHDFSNSASYGNRLDIQDWSDDFEVQRMSLLRPTAKHLYVTRSQLSGLA